MDADPTHLTTEQRRAMLAGVKEPDGEDGAVFVPHDYVTGIAGLILQELRARSITSNVEVQVNRNEPIVAITLARLVGGGCRQDTDCLAAWQANRDPRDVAREAARVFDENLERWAKGEM
jgi:hypothetical protein